MTSKWERSADASRGVGPRLGNGGSGRALRTFPAAASGAADQHAFLAPGVHFKAIKVIARRNIHIF